MLRLKKIICPTLALFIAATLFTGCSDLARPDVYSWVSRFGGTKSDFFYSAAASPDGDGFIAVGKSASKDLEMRSIADTSEDEEGIIRKYNNNGSVKWTKSVALGKTSTTLYRAKPVEDGYIIVGWTFTDGAAASDDSPSNSDCLVMKTDKNGETVWTKLIGGDDHDVVNGLDVAQDGSIFISGFTYDPSGDFGGGKTPMGSIDAFVMKLDAEGEILWSDIYGGSMEDAFYSVAANDDGGCVAVGSSNSTDFDMADKNENENINMATALRYDNNGARVWDKAIGGSGHDGFFGIAADGDGFVVSGYANSTDGDFDGINTPGAQDGLILRLTGDGEIDWATKVGGSKMESLAGICPRPDGGFTVYGYTGSDDGDAGDGAYGENDAWLADILSDGTVQGARRFGGDGSEIFNGAAVTDKGCFAVGFTLSKTDDLGHFYVRGSDDALAVLFLPKEYSAQ